jgi:hypothetical protein
MHALSEPLCRQLLSKLHFRTDCFSPCLSDDDDDDDGGDGDGGAQGQFQMSQLRWMAGRPRMDREYETNCFPLI